MKKKKSAIEILTIVIVVLGFLFYIIPLLVKYFGSDSDTIPEAFSDTKDEAIKKNDTLKLQLENDIEKKQKLDKKCKTSYFLVRITLFLFWLSLMGVLYFINWINSLEDFLNFSELCLIIIVSLNFLRFGKLSNLSDYVDLIKIRTENWVFRNDLNLDERIVTTQNQLINLGEK